ncbi:malonyl-ACP O-methyltransferase BioC [Cellvibrio fontiphilus]|uniref:Malonyl-[acyl-carrier protein] O-methyltransferase n=1 Tax=Cellvibrio fontiphilus TaxID=1815559 RepID=A0ABV7FEA6_9GAMM
MINLVLIHGWGCDSRIWQPVLPALQQIARVQLIDLPGFGQTELLAEYSLDAVLDKIAAQMPQDAVVMGWSLGGMLAVQLAARHPQKIIGVISLAANAKFVAAPDYPSAMARSVNRQFNQGFAQDAQATLKLFTGLLAQGDEQERNLLKQLRRVEIGEPNQNWLDALVLLAQLDNRAAFANLTQPGLHLFAEKDALVPVAAAAALRELNRQQQIQVLENTAHALHWSKPQAVIEVVKYFLLSLASSQQSSQLSPQLSPKQPPLLDKKKIAQSFGRAAATYDSVAQLQRDVGTALLQYLPDELPANARVLDLGCGTGFFTAQLRRKYPAAQMMGVDIAQGMLQFARTTHAGEIYWLGGDAENLPLADQSVDVIFSSLAIQWCSNLPQLMAELQRVLKPEGKLLIATLGPSTLYELKAAWQQVDGYVHVNRFAPPTEITAALAQSGLQLVQLNQHELTLYFARVNDLTRELKALGAHNINSGKPEGLTSRARLAAFKQAYEMFRTVRGLPASYDVIYLTATKVDAEKHHG